VTVDSYVIVNQHGLPLPYLKHRFRVTCESIPSNWVRHDSDDGRLEHPDASFELYEAALFGRDPSACTRLLAMVRELLEWEDREYRPIVSLALRRLDALLCWR
jgi:hypothetical protein